MARNKRGGDQYRKEEKRQRQKERIKEKLYLLFLFRPKKHRKKAREILR